jgi:heavy metal-binding protein
MRFLYAGALAVVLSAALCSQEGVSPAVSAPPIAKPGSAAVSSSPALEYVCPMDADIRSKTPGVCPRCGMKLVPGVPVFREYPVTMTTQPRALRVGEKVRLSFQIGDPETHKAVRDFEIVHEKLYHLFVISQDLSFFIHEHPQMQPDGSFQIDLSFPKPGFYRVLNDFYPASGTPQLVSRALFVPGPGFALATAKIEPDTSVQRSENLEVELVTEPRQPIAGMQTLMFFRLKPKDGIEPLLGAMGHMLAASSDLIDMIHDHPFQVTEPAGESYLQIQFNVIFPRPGVHRVWIQFQRHGVVNTVAFNVPVSELK